MNVYKNLEAMTQVAIHQAKEHNCNYNVILINPDENGEFSESNGSTYEMVANSYFNTERPNAKWIYKTDDLIAKEEIEEIMESNNMLGDHDKISTSFFDFDAIQESIPYHNIYRDMFNGAPLTEKQKNIKHVDVRTTPKIGNNEQCTCGSGKKYKKCCK